MGRVVQTTFIRNFPMAKRLTPQEIADKQVKRSTAATADYKKGIESVTVAPTQQAALAVDRYAAGVMKAVEDGKYVDSLNAVTLQDWQRQAIDKGAPNYAPGVQRSKDLIADFHDQRAKKQEEISRQLQSLPRGDLQQNLQRMLLQAQSMSNFRYKRRRR